MIRRYGLWVLALGLIATAMPVDAGSFENAVRARWRGAWIITEIETYSVCNGGYFNNDVSGQFVAARAPRDSVDFLIMNMSVLSWCLC